MHLFAGALAIIIAASPAMALECPEYEAAFQSGLIDAARSLGCTNMREEAFALCMTRGFFIPTDPAVMTFIAMMQDFQTQPAYRACFPDRKPMPF